MRRIVCFAALLLLPALTARAEMVVVVNAHSHVERLTREEVVNIYMGRYRKFADGSAAHPLDQAADAPERQAFYRKLLNKSQEEINAYWARLVFSGRTSPPVELKPREVLLKELESDPNAIAYVDRRNLPRGVKVVFSLPE